MRQARRRELIVFFEALVLALESGYDVGYAWPLTHCALESPEALSGLDEPIGEVLARLARTWPDSDVRLWFSILQELHASGAALAPAVATIAATLRDQQSRDLDAHCRRLPTRINVLLILFFLPPTLALLFIPLLGELLSSF